MSDEIIARLDALEKRMDTAERERLSMIEMVKRNTELTEGIAEDTQSLRQFLTEAAGAFRLLERISNGVRKFFKYVVLPLAVIVGIPWLLFSGELPSWLRTLAALLK